MAHNTGPTMSILEVFLRLRWLQICVGDNSSQSMHCGFCKPSLFSGASETKTNVVIIPFLRHDEGL